MARARLVDISRWQGDIDAAPLKAASVCGIVARCTVGWAYKDILYDKARQQAAANGMIFGAYHALYPMNKDPLREFNWFMDKCGEVDMHILDVELLHGLPLSAVQAQAKIWLDAATAAGLKPIVYSGSWFWKTAAGWENEFPLWEAEYTIRLPRGGIEWAQEPTGSPESLSAGWTAWMMWQWTSAGRPTGVKSESLDYDQFNGTEADLRAWLGKGVSDKEKLARLWDSHPELHD